MKGSLIISLFFVFGLIVGLLNLDVEFLYNDKLSLYVLYILLLFVGIGIGAESKIFSSIKKFKLKIILIPICVIIGTFIGVLIYSFISPTLGFKDLCAIGAGFGYYSLSSILISQESGDIVGTIALISNIVREVVTLLFAPLMVKYFGKIAPIASGGATSMDTTLPMVSKYSGKDYAILSVFNGIVLSVLVPVIISFIYGL